MLRSNTYYAYFEVDLGRRYVESDIFSACPPEFVISFAFTKYGAVN